MQKLLHIPPVASTRFHGFWRCARPESNFFQDDKIHQNGNRFRNEFGFFFMSSVPPGCSPLRLPRGEFVFYPSGRPSIRALTREIAALGYSVAVYPLQQPGLSRFPPGVWHWAVVLGDFILFLVLPSESAESSSDQSGYQSEDSPFYDSDNVDPENPGGGYGYWQLR